MSLAERLIRRPAGTCGTFFGLVAGLLIFADIWPATAGEWRIIAINGASTVEQPHIFFNADGSFAGNTGCNSFQGAARLEGRSLIVDGPVAATRMACPGDALTLQDDAIIGAFAGQLEIIFDLPRDVLSLSGPGAAIEMTPALPAGEAAPSTHAGLDAPRGDPPYLAAFGAPGTFEIRQKPSEEAESVVRIDAGAVLRNLGCAEADGARWCEVTLLDGTKEGWIASASLEAADSVLRAGQGVFDASGLIPCAKGVGAPMTRCAFGAARDGAGTATIVVTKPDSVERVLFFDAGAFVSSDTSQAGGGFETSVAKEGDLLFIRVDDERYEVPEAIIFGG